MDQEAIEAKALTPLSEEMGPISAITNKVSLSVYLGGTLNVEIEGLVDNADHLFGLWVNQGFEDSQHNFPHLLQGGLGMTGPDNYLVQSPEMDELRARYKAHVAAVLKLVNLP